MSSKAIKTSISPLPFTYESELLPQLLSLQDSHAGQQVINELIECGEKRAVAAASMPAGSHSDVHTLQQIDMESFISWADRQPGWSKRTIQDLHIAKKAMASDTYIGKAIRHFNRQPNEADLQYLHSHITRMRNDRMHEAEDGY